MELLVTVAMLDMLAMVATQDILELSMDKHLVVFQLLLLHICFIFKLILK